MSIVRVERHSREFGSYLWLFERIRFGSRNTMSPDYDGPRISKGGDEYCNDTIMINLYPLMAVDIWWRLHQRTWADGMCETCKQELRDGGWTEDQIFQMDMTHKVDGARYEDHRERLKDPVYRAAFEAELIELLGTVME